MTSCFSCGSTQNKVLACTGCRTVFYCDTACQTKDWQARHQNDCHLLKEMCDIGARLSLSGSHELIGKPVKRGASTSPSSDDKRDTKRANAVPTLPGSTGADGSSVADRSSEATASAAAPAVQRRETDLRKVVYPLPKDLFRLIALMVKLDAPALMRSSPAWAIFYEQIEWKNILLSRWDDPPGNAEAARKGAGSIGRWLYTHNIFDLYPNVLLDRSLYVPTPEQQAQVTAINQERRERLEANAIANGALGPDDEFVFDRDLEYGMADLALRESFIESDIFLSRVQAIPVNQDTQRALINIFMLYYMYEENVALVPQGHFLSFGGGQRGIRTDYDFKSRTGKGIELSNGDSNLKESMFFPVELLTDPLPEQDLEFITYDRWSGNDLKSILDIARYDEFLKPFGPFIVRSFGGFKLNLELTRIKNFPGALVQCASIIRNLGFRECGAFSERSFANLAKMTRLEVISVVRCEWETVSVDFYATCPFLRKATLMWQDEYTPRRIRVSPSVLRESKTPGVFGACFPPLTLSARNTKFPEFGFGLDTGMPKNTRARILPPGPFGGLARVDHVRRILKSAFLSGDWIEDREERESRRMFARLEAGLIKEQLLSLVVENDPLLDKEGDDVTNSFIKVLEATGISPIPAAQDLGDDGNVALPFRIWFLKGLAYRNKQSKVFATSIVPSFAVQACELSAVRRRGPGAKISLEEMAEALVAWMMSVRNMALFKRNGDEPRRKYCQFIQANSTARMSMSTKKDPYHWTWIVEHPTQFLSANIAHLSIPHEIVMSLLNQMTTRSEIADADMYCICNFKRFLGQVPAWMWLLPKRTETILVERARYFSLPPQLMYHPGLSTLSVVDSSSWGTPDQEPQWDLFHLAPEARPGPADAKDGTRMHQYFHDFARLELRMTDAPWTCFPPMDLSTYDAGLFLKFKQQLN